MISFDNIYARLPAECFTHVDPTPVKAPRLIISNDALAHQLGIDPVWLASEPGVAMLSGNTLPESSKSLAMAYAGHQFGQWVAQLGDGRAVLLGELTRGDQQRFEVQLKGAGRTPYSRGGDGRNWMGPVLREYLVSEAMAAIGVPTTRALAAVSTGEYVLRENGPLPGAIITRVARSHVRVGTFQYFAARQNDTALKALIDHVIERLYPHLVQAENKAHALLQAVVQAQASLVAYWQSIGFIHGVMNTDNCTLSGDTIDYGPCAFMDIYQADKVFSSIDLGARYAYQNQPRIAQWNLLYLAQCLLPFMHDDKNKAVELAQKEINQFDDIFVTHYLQRMNAKLGLDDDHDNDLELAADLLQKMQDSSLDFTITFTQLGHPSAQSPFAAGGPLHDWHLRWQQRLGGSSEAQALAQERMRGINPVVIPRNHQIEAVIDSAIGREDYSQFHALLEAVTSPFDTSHLDSVFAQAPRDEQAVTATFCGT